MLKVIFYKLKCQAEKITATEQADFTGTESTIEQIFNLRCLCEKYLRHQKNHRFQKKKKKKLTVWHATLWATMRKSNIDANVVSATEHLYDKSMVKFK